MAMIRNWQDALLYLVLVIVMILAGWQALDYFYFRNAGARFTAHDGQALCLRVQKMDGLPCAYDRVRR